ncbi:cation diffusion facilitator family transporter [Bradymonas sediminis]|uniref:Cation transporter n=1 Tax=Bradymonas sediminis TaxID=1548548 RepID=A0A2Z4FK60_9DELT|nr:cation diffusion facilitator family transporter [Bradymonas sediminis]AWV89058.1 cation transporter [Bradymonas sediminis]TDP64480.1 cation diffusion facilitator family transporter [Bradymonas sediminis]
MTLSPISGAPEDAQSDVARQIRRVLWVTMFLNIAVAMIKLGYGYSKGIVSLQASGFDSVFDGAANVIGLVAMGLAALPPDPEHPYGHRKLEVAVSLFIGLMVTLSFLEIGRTVWQSALSDTPIAIEPAAYLVVISSLVVSLGVSIYERREGNRLNSMLLKSDAAHTFADSLASVAVLAGIYLVDIGFPVGDILAALAVMFFVGITAYRVLRDGIDVLVDTSYLDPVAVRRVVKSHPDVLSCHNMRSRGMPGHVQLDLHVSLDPKMSLETAGDILLAVKANLREAFPEVADILIQIEPHKPIHIEDVPEKLL